MRNALMAEGRDPDDLLKTECRRICTVLAGAVSLIDMLWMQKLREFGEYTTRCTYPAGGILG